MLEDLNEPHERELARPHGQSWHGRELHLSGLDALGALLERTLSTVRVTFLFHCVYYDRPSTPDGLRHEFTRILARKLQKPFEHGRVSVIVDLEDE